MKIQTNSRFAFFDFCPRFILITTRILWKLRNLGNPGFFFNGLWKKFETKIQKSDFFLDLLRFWWNLHIMCRICSQIQWNKQIFNFFIFFHVMPFFREKNANLWCNFKKEMWPRVFMVERWFTYQIEANKNTNKLSLRDFWIFS